MSDAKAATHADDLRKVLKITRSMAAAADLDDLLGLIIDRSMELLAAERSTLFLYDARTDELTSRIAHKADEIRVPAGRGIVGACIREREVINVPDAYADDRFNPDVDRKTGFRTRNILAVPLTDYGGGLVGVLEVMNKQAGPFGDYDIELAETLAAQAGVAIQRANLIGHYLEKQKMARALEIAREIQQGLLPESDPEIPGYDVAGFSQPADETGGDIYDFIPLPDGRLGIVVADATGHGIGPALVVAQTRAMLRALGSGPGDVGRVLERVNDLLAADIGDGRFVTCVFAALDSRASTLTFSSAGHGPILAYHRAEDRFDQHSATGVPLGAFPGMSFSDSVTCRLTEGDFVVLLTDGLFEAPSPSGQLFGIERVMGILRECRDEPARGTIQRLREEVVAYGEGEPQADDLTAVMLRKT